MRGVVVVVERHGRESERARRRHHVQYGEYAKALAPHVREPFRLTLKLYPNHSRSPNPNLLVVHSKSYTDIFSSDGFVFKFSSAVVEMLLFAPPGELAPRLGLFIARTKVDHGST